ncbi:Fic/DOC family protein [Peptococcaceae bacterium CEB3]|nr:Fic/DOC family protein [Peptococcaceae bacterium CEB3]
MDYEALLGKKRYYQKHKNALSDFIVQNYEQAFEIEYTHNSTAIEGNTLSLIETKLLLEDKVSIGGKNLREIYEVVNHNKAYRYIKECIGKRELLDENRVKDIHMILMENIMPGGIYRNVDVYISGARHTPPSPNEAYQRIKNFYAALPYKTGMNAVELAAWTHAEFVKIHPFVDGNGRTSRLIMNYQLMVNGFLPISIAKEKRLDYYDVLDRYAVDGDLGPFAEFIATLEEKKLDFYIEAIEKSKTR